MWTEFFFDLHDLEVFSVNCRPLCADSAPRGHAVPTRPSSVCQVCAGPVAPGSECGSVNSRCVGTEVVSGNVLAAKLVDRPLAAPLVAC